MTRMCPPPLPNSPPLTSTSTVHPPLIPLIPFHAVPLLCFNGNMYLWIVLLHSSSEVMTTHVLLFLNPGRLWMSAAFRILIACAIVILWTLSTTTPRIGRQGNAAPPAKKRTTTPIQPQPPPRRRKELQRRFSRSRHLVYTFLFSYRLNSSLR